MPNSKGAKPDNPRSQQLTVVVRIRPLFQHEQEKGATKIARKADDKMVLLADPTAGDPVDVLRAKRAHDRKYVFDWAFDEHSTQEEVYEKTTKKLVENVVDGFNGTVFAYGATGSGKTYTMVGEDKNSGIMVRALKDLFKEVDTKHKIYDVTMSYLEIYNENIRDLLNPSPAHLDLREDAKGNHHVAGLSEVDIASSEEVMSLLMCGNKRRTQESTGANKTSSRSHAVLLVQVRRKSPAHSLNQQVRTGKLYMVDLAGSERAAQTQNTGKRLVEGAHINKSLLALGNCINALAERNPRYVNFRDSKLTRILKEPLSGNCRTVMVSHISPSHFHFEESRNTLAYADRAKNITTKLKSNVSDVAYHVAQYQTIIGELRQEIETLHSKMQDSKSTPTQDEKMDDSKEYAKKLTEEEMKELKRQLIQSFNTQMDVRRRLMEIDNSLLAQSVDFDKLAMIISEWETEKAVFALDNREDENRDSESNRDYDRRETPEHVQQVWDDLQFMKNQHHRYLEMREDCESDYRACKRKTMSVTESLTEKASSREQRELLNLLVRVYQLEIEKLEMQSSQLSREHELRCRDLMILRYDRQRQLCDEIITKQRMLIDALATGERSQNANARKELNELYRIYQQEIQELNSGRNSDLSQLNSHGSHYRPSSSGLRPLGSSGSMLELNHLDSMSPTQRNNALPPISSQGENNGQEETLFQKRKRQPFGRSSDEDTPPGTQLPTMSWQGGDIRNGWTTSRTSDSSSNSSSSRVEWRSMSTGSHLESMSQSTTSSNGRSTDSPDRQTQFMRRMEEYEDPFKKRFGILPSLRQRKGRGTSSDSEVLANNRNKQLEHDSLIPIRKKLQPEAIKHQVAEERRTKLWGDRKAVGY